MQKSPKVKIPADIFEAAWNANAAMEQIGQAIVDALASVGLPAEWDGTGRMRPCIDLRSLSA